MCCEQNREQHPQDVESQHQVLLSQSNHPVFQCDVHLPGLDYTSDGHGAIWCNQTILEVQVPELSISSAQPTLCQVTEDADTAKGPQVAGRTQSYEISCRDAKRQNTERNQCCLNDLRVTGYRSGII